MLEVLLKEPVSTRKGTRKGSEEWGCGSRPEAHSQHHRVDRSGEGRQRLPSTDHLCQKGEDGSGPNAEKLGLT